MVHLTRRSALLAAAALAAAGCTRSNDRPSTDTVRMTTGASTITDFDDYVADALGLYDRHGVTVDRIETQTAAQSVQLLATGDADIGRGLPNAIQARGRTAGRLDFVSVADPMLRPPFVMVTSGPTGWDALRGTKVGVSSVTDQTTVVTAGALKQLDVPAGDVELIPAGGTGSRLAALDAGGIDASLLLPPVNFEAEPLGLREMSYLPTDLGEKWQFSFTALLTSETWAGRNDELLIRFLQARDDALRWLADSSNADQAADILAEYTDTEIGEAEKTYELVYGSEVASFADRIAVSPKAAEGAFTGLEATDLYTSADTTVEDVTEDTYAAEARRRNDT
ncbi:ABC transporter substrate-binding protein [Nocardiopsis nanhaiensis]